MKTIRILALAALVATLQCHTRGARADDRGPLRTTFKKCAADDGSLRGRVDGDCGPGTVVFTYLSVEPGQAIWRFAGEYTIETTPDCSFKAVCDGTVDVRSGHIVLNGAVTEGRHLGAQVQVRAQASADLSCSKGTMTITPSGEDNRDHRNATVTGTRLLSGQAHVSPQVPFKATFHGFAGPATPTADPAVVEIVVPLQGTATHLGKFDEVLVHYINVSTLAFTGYADWTAANGDTFTTECYGQLYPTDDPALVTFEVTHTVVEGTGRFEGATGSFNGVNGLFNLVTGRDSGGYRGTFSY